MFGAAAAIIGNYVYIDGGEIAFPGRRQGDYVVRASKSRHFAIDV